MKKLCSIYILVCVAFSCTGEVAASPLEELVDRCEKELPGHVTDADVRVSSAPNTRALYIVRGWLARLSAEELTAATCPIDILVFGMSDESPSKRSVAAEGLAQIPLELLSQYVPEIVTALGANQDWPNELIERLGKTPSPLGREFLRAAASEGRPVPRKIIATWDQVVEKQLIQDFAAAADPRSRAILADELAYIGSAEAARALARALYSPGTVRLDANRSRSLSYVVLLALGKIYPKAEIFGEDLESVIAAERSTTNSDLRRDTKLKYFHRVEEWLDKNLGLELAGAFPDTPFVQRVRSEHHR